MATILLLRGENQQLQKKLELLIQDQERARAKVAERILNNHIEKEDLLNQIKLLKEEIALLTTEVNQCKASQGLSVTASADLELDESAEIKAGTMSKLIESLYMDHDNVQTTEYMNVFLLTYRSFATASQVLETLISGYNRLQLDKNSEALKARLRIGNFLKRWINDSFYDFNDTELQDRYAYFVNEIIFKSDATLGNSLKGTLASKQKGVERRASKAIFSTAAPPPLVPPKSSTPFDDISPIEIARQMTLVDYNLCRAIEPMECLGLAWTKPDKEERASNLLQMIRRFNQVSKWVAVTIVSEANIKRRTKLLTHFIDIMKNLEELNNFGAIFQIVGGLGNSSVHRLAKTFAGLKPEKKKILEEMRVLTNPNKSWAQYRKRIHEVNPPCVPFVGVYQTDLTFIEDGNPSKFSTGLINFKKCRLVASVIVEIQQYQQKPYNLNIVPLVADALQKSLEEAAQMEEKMLYDTSLSAEPRTP